MDRVAFLQSIRVENQEILIQYFDQFMGIYGLIPNTDFKIEVRPSREVEQGIIVDFKFQGIENYELVTKIRNDIQSRGGTITVYSHTYFLQMISGSPSGFSLFVGL